MVEQVVEAELGEVLVHAARGRAPLGLVELEHQALTAPATSSCTIEDFAPQVDDIISVGEFYGRAAGGQIILT
jgi:hypothetical protein